MGSRGKIHLDRLCDPVAIFCDQVRRSHGQYVAEWEGIAIPSTALTCHEQAARVPAEEVRQLLKAVSSSTEGARVVSWGAVGILLARGSFNPQDALASCEGRPTAFSEATTAYLRHLEADTAHPLPARRDRAATLLQSGVALLTRTGDLDVADAANVPLLVKPVLILKHDTPAWLRQHVVTVTSTKCLTDLFDLRYPVWERYKTVAHYTDSSRTLDELRAAAEVLNSKSAAQGRSSSLRPLVEDVEDIFNKKHTDDKKKRLQANFALKLADPAQYCTLAAGQQAATIVAEMYDGRRKGDGQTSGYKDMNEVVALANYSRQNKYVQHLLVAIYASPHAARLFGTDNQAAVDRLIAVLMAAVPQEVKELIVHIACTPSLHDLVGFPATGTVAVDALRLLCLGLSVCQGAEDLITQEGVDHAMVGALAPEALALQERLATANPDAPTLLFTKAIMEDPSGGRAALLPSQQVYTGYLLAPLEERVFVAVAAAAEKGVTPEKLCQEHTSGYEECVRAHAQASVSRYMASHGLEGGAAPSWVTLCGPPLEDKIDWRPPEVTGALAGRTAWRNLANRLKPGSYRELATRRRNGQPPRHDRAGGSAAGPPAPAPAPPAPAPPAPAPAPPAAPPAPQAAPPPAAPPAPAPPAPPAPAPAAPPPPPPAPPASATESVAVAAAQLRADELRLAEQLRRHQAHARSEAERLAARQAQVQQQEAASARRATEQEADRSSLAARGAELDRRQAQLDRQHAQLLKLHADLQKQAADLKRREQAAAATAAAAAAAVHGVQGPSRSQPSAQDRQDRQAREQALEQARERALAAREAELDTREEQADQRHRRNNLREAEQRSEWDRLNEAWEEVNERARELDIPPHKRRRLHEDKDEEDEGGREEALLRYPPMPRVVRAPLAGLSINNSINARPPVRGRGVPILNALYPKLAPKLAQMR